MKFIIVFLCLAAACVVSANLEVPIDQSLDRVMHLLERLRMVIPDQPEVIMNLDKGLNILKRAKMSGSNENRALNRDPLKFIIDTLNVFG